MIDVEKLKAKVKAKEDEFARLSTNLEVMQRQLSGGRDRQLTLGGEISALRELVKEAGSGATDKPATPPPAENIRHRGNGHGENN